MKIPLILEERAKLLETYYETHYKPLAPLVKQCFLNTIETTVKQLEDGIILNMVRFMLTRRMDMAIII